MGGGGAGSFSEGIRGPPGLRKSGGEGWGILRARGGLRGALRRGAGGAGGLCGVSGVWRGRRRPWEGGLGLSGALAGSEGVFEEGVPEAKRSLESEWWGEGWGGRLRGGGWGVTRDPWGGWGGARKTKGWDRIPTGELWGEMGGSRVGLG